MIKINKEVDYAIQFILALASQPESTMSLRTFSSDKSISFLFMQKIAQKLRKSDIIASRRGANGGYVINRSPKQLTLNDIYEAIEGSYALTTCEGKSQTCKHIANCKARKPLRQIEQQMQTYMNAVTVQSLI